MKWKLAKKETHCGDYFITILLDCEYSHTIFRGSFPLTEFEQQVLNDTFNKNIKYKPTLPRRK